MKVKNYVKKKMTNEERKIYSCFSSSNGMFLNLGISWLESLGNSSIFVIYNFDGVVLEIYLDHKFQWPQEGLNYECLAYEVVNPLSHKYLNIYKFLDSFEMNIKLSIVIMPLMISDESREILLFIYNTPFF